MVVVVVVVVIEAKGIPPHTIVRYMQMALSGFRVKTSDSIIMMNHLTHPLLMRPKNSDTQTIGTGSIPKSGDGPTDPTLSDQNPQPYAEYHRGGYPHHRHAISQLLPTQQRRIHHDMKCTLRHYYDQKYHRTFPCSL